MNIREERYRILFFSNFLRRLAPGKNQQGTYLRIDIIKNLVHGHLIPVLHFDGAWFLGGHIHFYTRFFKPVIRNQQFGVFEIVRAYY